MTQGPVQIWGVMMVRNEADIVAVNLLHHLHCGIDRFLIVDDGSSDGTDRVLRELGRDDRISWSRRTGRFHQAAIITELAREAYLQGADWVLPIDADEFWWTPGGDLHGVLQSTDATALEAEIVNFVQRRDQIERGPDALLHATRRTAAPIGPVNRTRQLVEERQIAFVEMRYPSKWISRASLALEIAEGDHEVDGVPGVRKKIDSITCLHVPVRARATLDARVAHGRRVDETGQPAGLAWHVRRMVRIAAEGALESEWRANSYEGDWLDVYGARHPLVVDSRLRDVVAPWIGPAAAASTRALTTNAVRLSAPSGRRAGPGDPDRASGAMAMVVHDLDAEKATAVLDVVNSIEGWMHDGEPEFLVQTTARAVRELAPLPIVEIGSYCGKSTILMGSVARHLDPGTKVYAIDPHRGELGAPGLYTRKESPTLARFTRNVAESGLHDTIELIQQYSFEVVWHWPIGLLFVDGLHDRANVARDFAHFDTWIVPGGYAVFHDYDDYHTGVKSVVDEVVRGGRYQVSSRAQSTIVLRKRAGHGSGAGTRAGSMVPALAELRLQAERVVRYEQGMPFLRQYLKEQVAHREQSVRELDAALGRAASALQSVEARIAALEGTRVVLQESRAREQISVSSLQRQVNDILTSTSWAVASRLARWQAPFARVGGRREGLWRRWVHALKAMIRR